MRTLLSGLSLALLLAGAPALAAGDGHAAPAEHGAAAAGGHGAPAAEGAHGAPEAHFDPVALGLHGFNLVLLLGVLGFFALPKVRDGLKTRAVEVKREIDESNRARKESREKFEELEARLSGFEDQLASMKKEAEKEASIERLAILERAERDAVRIREAAERTIRGETARARMALRRDAVALSMKLAEERLAGQVDQVDDQRLSGDFFAMVDGKEARNG